MTVSADTFGAYWDRVAEGDSAGAVRIASAELDRGAHVVDVLEGLVAAAQAEVGRLWAANRWNVAAEHRATAVSEDVLATVAARTATEPGDRHIVITCVDGEWHALPSRILGTALRAGGWRVTFLGASVPVPHLTQLLHEVGPDVVAVSCALSTRLFAARQTIVAVRSTGIAALCGGRGFGPDGAWAIALGGNAWAPDARSALDLLAGGQLSGVVGPAPDHHAPDELIGLLRARSAEIVAESMRRMTGELPDVAAYDSRQARRSAEDVAHIVEFLCAALYVGDVALFTGFIEWLAGILAARGVPRSTLRTGLGIIAEVIGASQGPYALALDYLAAGREAVESTE